MLRILALAMLLFQTAATSPPPEHVAKYLQRCAAARAAEIKAKEGEIKTLTPQAGTNDEARKKLATAQSELKTLQEQPAPLARLPLPPKKGDLGILATTPVVSGKYVDVIEIVDESNAILRAWYPSTAAPSAVQQDADNATFVDVWAQGIDTSALAAGSPARLNHVFHVTGNKSFGTCCGQRSLLLLEPLDIERFRTASPQ